MIFPDARAGIPVQILGQELEFSYYPMRRTRRWGRQSTIYAADVWGLIHGSLADQCSLAELPSAQSFVRQAREYFSAADRASTVETRPLLYYYALLNLAKALAIARGRSGLVGKVRHGIAHSYIPRETVEAATLTSQRTGAGDAQVFDELHQTITGKPLTTPLTYDLAVLMPQSLVGHRIWLQAAKRSREHFIAIEKIRLMHDPSTQQLWSTVEVSADLLRRHDWGVGATLDRSGLSSTHRVVKDRVVGAVSHRVFEQVSPVFYGHRSSDRIMETVDLLRPALWRTISSTPPYRRYYLYLSPPGDRPPLPQVCASYALMFFLGSLTRYHPAYLLEIMNGDFGAFFGEFIATQPHQLLFEFASEFKRQEVSRAAVV